MVARACVLLSLLALPALAQPRPAYSVQATGVVAATLPASILTESDVQKRLTSGLTTTFLVVARNRGTDAVSGARVEVRYDLWDEVWLVRRIEFDRKSERQRIASMAELEKWWRTPLRLLSTDASRVSLQLDLTVLPFSAAESDDARQWISKSGGVGTGGAGNAGFVEALIGTTISARPITSFRWNVALSLKEP